MKENSKILFWGNCRCIIIISLCLQNMNLNKYLPFIISKSIQFFYWYRIVLVIKIHFSIANLRKLYNKCFFPWCRQIIQWHAKRSCLNLYKKASRWSILKGRCKIYCTCWLLPLGLTVSAVNGVFICVLRAHRGMFVLLYNWFEL